MRVHPCVLRERPRVHQQPSAQPLPLPRLALQQLPKQQLSPAEPLPRLALEALLQLALPRPLEQWAPAQPGLQPPERRAFWRAARVRRRRAWFPLRQAALLPRPQLAAPQLLPDEPRLPRLQALWLQPDRWADAKQSLAELPARRYSAPGEASERSYAARGAKVRQAVEQRPPLTESAWLRPREAAQRLALPVNGYAGQPLLFLFAWPE